MRAFAKVAASLGHNVSEPSDYNFRDQLSDADIDRVFDETERIPNWWMSFHAYADNVRAIAAHRIAHPEDELHYVTNRRHARLGLPLLHQSQKWVESCGIGGIGTGVVVTPPDEFKTRVYKVLDIPAFIDDNLTIVKQAGSSQRAYLLDRPWNRDGRDGVRVVISVEEFLREVRR